MNTVARWNSVDSTVEQLKHSPSLAYSTAEIELRIYSCGFGRIYNLASVTLVERFLFRVISEWTWLYAFIH